MEGEIRQRVNERQTKEERESPERGRNRNNCREERKSEGVRESDRGGEERESTQKMKRMNGGMEAAAA